MPYSGEYDGSIVAVLEQLLVTADLEGLAVLDLSQDEAISPVAYSVGVAGAEVIDLGRRLLLGAPDRVSHAMALDKRSILACAWVLPPAQPGGLLLWRAPKSRSWKDSDHRLAAGIAMLLRVSIGAGMGQIGIDRLTGLPNRRWFLDEVDRHIDRLDIDTRVSTLMLLDVDNLQEINGALGREQGDRVLLRIAGQLRDTVRPGDLVARVGADEFAVWQNGVDHLTAAERADSLCSRWLFQDLPEGRTARFSIGIASRQVGSAEDVRALLRRARLAVREAKAAGGGGWRVSHPTPISGFSEAPR